MTELNNSKGNILLVDDLPKNLQLLSDLLIKFGYTVRSVKSGRMALKTIKVKQPDIILLDIKMPEMDGYQVCDAIKADHDLKDIPIIFLSVLDDTFDKVKSFEHGGVDYITKPFQIEEVIARLENQLIIRRQHNLLQQEIRKRKEAEEILNRSAALLSSILNTSLDGIVALEAIREPISREVIDFRCLAINPVIAKVLQKSCEEITNKLVLRKLLYRINPGLFNRFISVVETGKFIEEDFHYPYGESSWYHFVAVKLGDGFAITIRDITSRKKIELELKAANQKLALLANLDGLTQIANRRCFDDYLKQEWQEHLQNQTSLSLILIDIDYFKSYNDYYGHQCGDHCLIQVAQTLRTISKRTTDLVARYGGEEFVMILPNTNLKGAVNFAKNIRKAIADLQIPHAQSPVKPNISISLGISSLIPNVKNSWEDLIFQADQALYQAKSAGRDRLIFNP